MKIWDRTVSGMEDGKGYSRYDKSFVRSLLHQDPWTDKQKKSVYDMLQKYEGQFNELDIDLEDYVEGPPNVETQSDKFQGVKVDYNDGRVEVTIGNTEKFRTIKNTLKEDYNFKYDGDQNPPVWYKSFLSGIESLFNELERYCDKIKYCNNVKNKVKESNEYEVEVYYSTEETITIDMEYDCQNFDKIKRIVKRDLQGQYDSETYHWNVPDIPEQVVNKLGFYDNVKIYSGVENQANRDDTEANLFYELSEADDADYEEPNSFEGELYGYQKASTVYAKNNKRTLIAEELGSGKSVVSLATLEDVEELPCFIICPSNAKYKWVESEIEEFTDRTAYVMEGYDNETIPEVDFVISNYRILNERINQLVDYPFESIVVDECHRIKNDDTQQHGAVETFIEEHEPEYRLFLSGTPYQNRPEELIEPLKLLDRLDDMGGWERFISRYCAGSYHCIICCSDDKYKTVKSLLDSVGAKYTGEGTEYSIRVSKISEFWSKLNKINDNDDKPFIHPKKDIRVFPKTDGASNLGELHRKLRETCMVRHPEEIVNEQLPDTNRIIHPIDVDTDEYEKIVQQIIKNAEIDHAQELKEIEARMDKAESQGDMETYNELEAKYEAKKDSLPLELIKETKVRKELVEMKKDYVTNLADNILANNDKLVIFSHHRDMANHLEDYYDNTVLVDGRIDADEKNERQKQFQEDENVEVFIGQMRSCMEAVDLDASDACLFAEFDDNPQVHKQCEGRLRRATQESDQITSYYLACNDTVESDLIERLERKYSMFERGIEGNKDSDKMFDEANETKHDDGIPI
jgi:superfamily II DNA or RNA helicase